MPRARWRTRSCSPARAAPARRPWRGSWPRRSTAENLAANADPCDACHACNAIREGRALDLVEIDAASNRGINDVRELRERLSYAPTDLRRKIYILDEAHQITKDAWNALLKSLEEPPDFVTFMFASTHPQDFPPAILSRLQRFDVRRLTVPEITGKLERILAADGREADPEAIRVIARLAAGGMRDAESILDQLLGSTAGRIEADAVRDLLGLADAELVDGFVAALAGGDAAAGIVLLDRLEERGQGPARVPGPGGRHAARAAARGAGGSRHRRPRDRGGGPPPGRPSTRRASAPVASACSWSSPCSSRPLALGRQPQPARPPSRSPPGDDPGRWSAPSAPGAPSRAAAARRAAPEPAAERP